MKSRRIKKSKSSKFQQSLNIGLLLIYAVLASFLLFLIFKYQILAVSYFLGSSFSAHSIIIPLVDR